jgi:hypothetical protein
MDLSTIDTSKLEAIADLLQHQFSKLSDKWTKCQWTKKMGTLGLIDLKNRTAADVYDLIVGARFRVEKLLSTLADAGYEYKLVVSLADAAEWEKYGEQVDAYLRDVERRAYEAARCAGELIEGIQDRELASASIKAAEILRLESVRPSGQFVWKKFCHTVQEIIRALQRGWIPRWTIRTDDQHVILGNRQEGNRSEEVYTAYEWNRMEGGFPSPCSWTMKFVGDTVQWLFNGQIQVDPKVEAV